MGIEKAINWDLRVVNGCRPDPRPGETVPYAGKNRTFDEMDDLGETASKTVGAKTFNIRGSGTGLNMWIGAQAALSARAGKILSPLRELLRFYRDAGNGHDEGLSLAYCGGHDSALLTVLPLDPDFVAPLLRARFAAYDFAWSGGRCWLPCPRNSWSNHQHVADMIGAPAADRPGPEFVRRSFSGTGTAILQRILERHPDLDRRLRFATKAERDAALEDLRLKQPISVGRTLLQDPRTVLWIDGLQSYDNPTPVTIPGLRQRLGTPYTLLRPGPGEKRRPGRYPKTRCRVHWSGQSVETSWRSAYGDPNGPVDEEKYEARVGLLDPASVYRIGDSGTETEPAPPQLPPDDGPETAPDEKDDSEPDSKDWVVRSRVFVPKKPSAEAAIEFVERQLLSDSGREFMKHEAHRAKEPT